VIARRAVCRVVARREFRIVEDRVDETLREQMLYEHCVNGFARQIGFSAVRHSV
jgi:hypothetical protein